MAPVELQTWKTLEKTYGMIKPDAVRAGKVDAILKAAEDAGFVVVASLRTQLTPERAGEFYGEHKGKPFYDGLVGFMSGGPIVACCFAKTNAIMDWRTLMGPTNTFKARDEAPTSLRALHGTDGTQNATHGSDSPLSAMRELKFFFPNLVLDPVPEGAAARDFIKTNLTPTLVKGLAALCKEKPSAGKLEAIAWLADWLLANNPNKAQSFTEAELFLDPDNEDDDNFFAEEVVVHATNAAMDAEDPADAVAEMEEQQQAATKLQSHFRGHKTRKDMAARRTSGGGGGGGVMVLESHTGASGEEAPPVYGEEENKAANTVQASFRGSQARKETKKMKAEESAAATKVQSGFRGHQDRKKVAAMKAGQATADAPAAEEEVVAA
mmetsp:Transcript_11196/g.27266  ORF Transcript_11196/g.27266 Transcript_11196/m.27266 type:complete len:381 (-) Transcript_11196:104-1246(-)|eukprot:CAMPEP_0197574872 /NCGR_PEP_ID=MMETSP1326-20131121/460_1 /TAXON_ID=1155430 /ORGANISM="Genus nov. species nov., Strain RCC2288" /LENGTH=380 /DNA_ID=CAMNT_0043137531 /DNA_START=165 /DNA_END=1307 /DNA_ORIENTATION=+